MKRIYQSLLIFCVTIIGCMTLLRTSAGSRYFWLASRLDEKGTFSQATIDTNATHFLFLVYFIEEDQGMYYALSTDGINWQPLYGGKPVFSPKTGSQQLVRDPAVYRGPDGVYRLVWTTGWRGKDIGYAYSSDLIHWSEPKALAVGQTVDSINNCWAPEIFYNDRKKQYMVYWSSNIGPWRKPEGEGRIYAVTTKDFNTFSQPAILYRNGFPGGGQAGNDGPIDAFLYRNGKADYLFFYKKDDNTGVPNIYYRRGKSPEGPWQEEQGPIVPSTGDEGPSCIKHNGLYHIYTDPFESDSAYVYLSRDLKRWERKATNLSMKHGTVIEIPRKTAMGLLRLRPQ